MQTYWEKCTYCGKSFGDLIQVTLHLMRGNKCAEQHERMKCALQNLLEKDCA